MNLVEKLLATEKGIIEKAQTEEIPSKMLAKLLGEEKPVNVTVKALDGDTFTNLSLSGCDDDGEIILEKSFDTTAKIAAAGLVNPNVKDEALLEHVGAATPAEAVKIIFKGETNRIGMAVRDLSGFGEEDPEEVEKVKN